MRISRTLIITFTFFITLLWMTPPISQSIDYHNFADQRTILAIPNAMNVLSNIPFLLVGFYCLCAITTSAKPLCHHMIAINYRLFFVGIILTGVGSIIYHLEPNNITIIFDRMGIAFSFMALFTALLGELVDIKIGRKMLFPLIFFGLASVIYWGGSEYVSRGDLRFYILTQYLPIIILPILLVGYRWRYSHQNQVFYIFVFYILAKIAEHQDQELFQLSGVISGHTLKHLLAVFASYWVYRILATRTDRTLKK